MPYTLCARETAGGSEEREGLMGEERERGSEGA